MICPGCLGDVPFDDLPTRRAYQYGAWWHRRCWHKFYVKQRMRRMIEAIFLGGPWKA